MGRIVAEGQSESKIHGEGKRSQESGDGRGCVACGVLSWLNCSLNRWLSIGVCMCAPRGGEKVGGVLACCGWMCWYVWYLDRPLGFIAKLFLLRRLLCGWVRMG